MVGWIKAVSRKLVAIWRILLGRAVISGVTFQPGEGGIKIGESPKDILIQNCTFIGDNPGIVVESK